MARDWLSGRNARRHLSDETILLHLDGALDPVEDARAERHLRDCWTCRASRERLEQAIAAFMEERRQQLSGDHNGVDSGSFAFRLSGHAGKLRSAGVQPYFPFLNSLKRALWPLAAAAAAIAAVGGWPPLRDYVFDDPAEVEPVSAPFSSLPSVPPDALALSPLPGTVVPPPPEMTSDRTPLAELGPSAADLDAAELQAYFAIHEQGQCRGGSIEVLRLPGQAILVSGAAVTVEAGERLAARLKDIPHVRVHIQLPDDVLPLAPEGSGSAVVLVGQPPLLEQRLKEHFRKHSPPDRAGSDMAGFSSRAVRLANAAVTEVQALRILNTVFTSRRIDVMRTADREKFIHIVEEHLGEYRQNIAHLGLLLGRLDQFTPPPMSEEQPLSARDANWALQLERDTARLDYLSGGLFAGLDLPGLDADSAWTELRLLQSRLEVWLQTDAAAVTAAWFESRNEITESGEPKSR